MSLARRIAQNSAALLASNIANKFLGFLIMLSVARFLGTGQFGLYTWVFAYVSVFALATDLGLSTVVIRGITLSDETGGRWLGNALLVRWPVSILTYFVCVGSAALFAGFDARTMLVAASALSFLSIPLSTYSAVFSARMKLYGPALISLGSKVLLFGAVQWIARSGGSILQLVGAEVVIGTLSSVIIWLWSASMLRPLFAWDRATVRAMLAEGVPLFLTSVFVTLYFRIDVFFLQHYRSEAEIGLYAAAYRLTEALPLIAGALANSIFPVLCRQIHEGDTRGPDRLVGVSLRLLEAGIVPVAFLTSYYSVAITQFLYGDRFDGSASLLAVLVFGQMAVYANILFSTVLVARGMSRQLMFLTVGMLAFNIVANVLVIPVYGALGAAATTVATEVVGTLGCVMLTSSAKVVLTSVRRLTLPAATCGIVLFVLRPAPDWRIEAVLPALVTALAYPAVLYLSGSFSRDEWKRLRELAWR